MVPHLYESSCSFQHQASNAKVGGAGAIRRGGDDVPVYRAAHMGDFLWAFVNEQDEEVALDQDGSGNN